MFEEDENPYNHIGKTKNRFIQNYMSFVAKYGPLFSDYTIQDKHQEVFQEIFSRTTFSANIPQVRILSVCLFFFFCFLFFFFFFFSFFFRNSF